jgi:hypothetical protein
MPTGAGPRNQTEHEHGTNQNRTGRLLGHFSTFYWRRHAARAGLLEVAAKSRGGCGGKSVRNQLLGRQGAPTVNPLKSNGYFSFAWLVRIAYNV